MITSLRLVNFKNFADETLRMGPFTLIVGANASGKSNIRDAFRFLHGIGRGYTLPEIIGGKYGAGSQIEWEAMRGAPNEIARLGTGFPAHVSLYLPSIFGLQVELDLAGRKTFYSIKIRFEPDSPDGLLVVGEKLRTESAMIYTTMDIRDSLHWLRVGNSEKERQIGFSRAQPALTQFLQRYKEIWYQYISEVGLHSVLDSMRFLDLSPERMREPSFPGADTLGDTGENLPTVLEKINADPQRRDVLASWLQELTPMDVVDFKFPRDPSGRIHLQILERNGRKVSAYSASDGTLRFLGMLAALLREDRAGIYFFEEIDNAIHPSRLSLLIELIERQTAKGGVQVVATTHSPGLLDLVNDTTFESTSVVYRGEDSADAVIRPVSDLPRVRELRKSQGLGRLHASGWMEDILTLKGWREEDAHAGQ